MQYHHSSPDAVIHAAFRIMESRARVTSHSLTSPQLASKLFVLKIGQLEHEVFMVAFADNQNRLIAAEEMFRGTIDGASVYPREVVKRAMQLNASAVVFGHNHPSGVVEPSRADVAITKRLQEALALVDVRVLDHIIVSNQDHLSFAEQGYL